MFLSLAFATKEELGWDPTIRETALNDGKRTYHIDVGDETFETIQVLADNADMLDSHATRVWKVKQPNTDEPCVLKDVWIYQDAFSRSRSSQNSDCLCYPR